MRRALPMLVTAALLVGACSGGSDDTTESTVATPDTVVATSEAPPPPTDAPTTVEATTTEAPTTTIDEAALLAAAEAAYLEAFEVSKEILRDPSNPDNEDLIRAHFTGPNLEATLEALRLTIDGNFVARVNEDNPTFALVIEPAEFVEGDTTVARMAVCEFNSDQIFEIGTAPGGGDSLRRDYPVSILITIRMELVDGAWKSSSGTRGEEIRDEAERCSDAR